MLLDVRGMLGLRLALFVVVEEGGLLVDVVVRGDGVMLLAGPSIDEMSMGEIELHDDVVGERAGEDQMTYVHVLRQPREAVHRGEILEEIESEIDVPFELCVVGWNSFEDWKLLELPMEAIDPEALTVDFTDALARCGHGTGLNMLILRASIDMCDRQIR